MKLKKHLITVALIFFVMTFLRGNVSAYDMAEYFPLNQGDEWIYLNNFPYDGRLPVKKVIDGTELVNGVETIKFENGDCYAMDSEGLKMYKWNEPGPMYLIFDPPRIIFPAQFDVGETYLGSISAKVYSSDDDTFLDLTLTGNNTVILKSVEDVTVPAGTFKDCLKIYTYMTLQPGDYNVVETTEWYARNIGLIKRIDYCKTVLISATVDGVHYGCPATFALERDSNDLNTLRKFRDEVLSKTPVGQEIIKLYYELSPVIVKAMTEDKEFREEVKDMIDGILPLVRKAVE